MSVSELAVKLCQFESTHERMEIMQECLNFCISFFDGLPVFINRFEHEGVPCVVIQTHETKEVDVLFLGHIDTVPGKPELFVGRVEEGKLYGRGTLDMKAFVATSMVAFKELVEEKTNRNLALAIVCDEELGGAHGARYLVEEIGYHAGTVLVPDDGESIDRLVVASKHIFQLVFTAHGKEAHAARPWRGDNAIQKLMRVFDRLEKSVGRHEKEPETTWVNTINLGLIQGGTASNEVPEGAEMTVDIRVTPDTTTREQVLNWVESALEQGVEFKVKLEGHPILLDKNDPVVQTYAQAMESVTQRPIIEAKQGGATDGRYFAAKGMRVIVHQGTGALCQSDEEHVELASLQQLVEIQKKFIGTLAN